MTIRGVNYGYSLLICSLWKEGAGSLVPSLHFDWLIPEKKGISDNLLLGQLTELKTDYLLF